MYVASVAPMNDVHGIDTSPTDSASVTMARSHVAPEHEHSRSIPSNDTPQDPQVGVLAGYNCEWPSPATL